MNELTRCKHLTPLKILKVMLCAQATDVFGRLNGEKMEGSDDTEQNNIFFKKI